MAASAEAIAGDAAFPSAATVADADEVDETPVFALTVNGPFPFEVEESVAANDDSDFSIPKLLVDAAAGEDAEVDDVDDDVANPLLNEGVLPEDKELTASASASESSERV